MDSHADIRSECRIRGVDFNIIPPEQLLSIYSEINNNNMEIILLEKSPKIAIYTPPNKQPWDDAVTLALTYAEVNYETLWDDDVLQGQLSKYDWLHLHHEDFTGQYGKFYRSYHNSKWYKDQKRNSENMARRLGFKSVRRRKKGCCKYNKELCR